MDISCFHSLFTNRPEEGTMLPPFPFLVMSCSAGWSPKLCLFSGPFSFWPFYCLVFPEWGIGKEIFWIPGECKKKKSVFTKRNRKYSKGENLYIYLGPCLQVLKLLRLYTDPWSKTFVPVGSFLELEIFHWGGTCGGVDSYTWFHPMWEESWGWDRYYCETSLHYVKWVFT